MARTRRTLFDPAQAKGPRLGPDAGTIEPKNGEPAAMSVSALIGRIKAALSSALPERFCVVGEISNLSMPASGHVYFSLKDSCAAIRAAMWRAQAERLKFRPSDGLEVVVEGRIDVYDVQGTLQLYVERMTPRGAGALELAFRQLKEKLEAEGLFDPARKKPIAKFPRALGVVTSGTGAAIRDIQRTLRRRWPAAEVYLVPVPVQGEGSAEKIAEAIRLLDANAQRYQIDTILVARGGGSLEDLWAFNEEALARAVAAAHTPIISGVGHEVDVTICDLVADVRAPTPTGAAELAVPDREDIRRHVEHLALRLRRFVLDKLTTSRQKLEGLLRSAVFRDPAGRVRNSMQRVDELAHRLRASLHGALAQAARKLQPIANRLSAQHPARLIERARAKVDNQLARLRWVLGGRSKRAGDQLAALQRRLEKVDPVHRLRLERQNLDALARQLEALSYRNVLKRGFSVTRTSEGKLLRSASEVQTGQMIHTELSDGAFYSEVTEEKSQTAPNSKRNPKTSETTKPIEKHRTKKKSQKDNGPSLFDGF